MSRTRVIEIEGKTIKEAIQKALKEIKLPLNRIKIQILREEEKGLFKLSGAKSAKIRILIK
ncbi:MAG: Jag N-terminal domain-containing protein [Candidatus Omnitrophica bacterium]|nr:Jag N-terminal domain-containing protein [Candidatus Omnitrophota bacterium]